ncbi:hypothetical protein [Anaerosinus massiliensis]|uniref:hypothetical protein n=1 Tax=Massilibacillus massiliensis TaxID=1806837 RepID=UPI000DA60414|nr:hypothetical protein [Massilibacillus massiliensis]
MLHYMNCIQEVEIMCKEAWMPSDIAAGEYWMEITWKRQNSENKFMIIYGKENIDIVNKILDFHHEADETIINHGEKSA